MSRAGLTAAALLILAGLMPNAAAAPPWIVLPTSIPSSPIPNDPFPIRRIFLQPNRAPDEMGTFVRLPRDAFEQKIRAAADALRQPPRIAAAQYTATLTDGALTGTAEWTIRNPGGRSGLLPLNPHRLALGRPRWADGSAARLIRTTAGDDTPKTFVWLDAANAADGARLQADWSLRAMGEADEPRFELRVPPAGIATMTLTLPPGLAPRVSADDGFVSGPTSTGDPNRLRWRITFGGRSSVDLVVAPNERNRPAQPGQVKTTLRIAVAEGRADGTYRFELDPTHQPGDAYILDVDERVAVLSVAADVPIDWQPEPVRTGTPASIRVVPREAGRIGRLQVNVAVNPPPPGSRWAVPAIRLRHALPSETTIQLKLAPELQLRELDSGDFRLSESDQGDAGRTMTWTSTLARPGAVERTCPTFATALVQSSVSISERATFTVTGTECFLRVAATVTGQRGPVSTFQFTLPENYRTAVVPSVAGDALAAVRFEETKPAHWIVSLSRPLATGQSTTVSFALAAPRPAIQSGVVRVPVPAVVWPSASRNGSATVSVSSDWAPISPLVVAYQDLPPAGHLDLRVAELIASGQEQRLAEDRSPRSAEPLIAEAPVFATARIGDRSIHLTISGVTGLAGNRTRVSLPLESSVRSVQWGDRAIDHPNIVSGELILPACLTDAVPYEIHVEWKRTGAFLERIRVNWPDGSTMPIRWSGDSNWLVATGGNGESAFAVRREGIAGIGWLLAAGLLVPLATIVSAGPTRRRSLIVLIAAAVACGTIVAGQIAGSAFVPPLVVSLAGLLISLVRTAPTLAVAGILFSVTAEAAAPQPVTVYLMYGTGEESRTLFAFAPKAVLERLDRIAGNIEPELAIASARYIGSERSDEATFQAQWTVHVPPGTPHTLNVPLAGVKLESVSLDGSPAFPEPLPGGGFSLSLPNRGTHIVSANFAVPIRTSARVREIRFSGPDVAVASLEFTAKSPSSRVDVSSRRGRQSQVLREGHAVTTADLGEGRAVAIRWQDSDSKAVAASAEATLEAAVWDVEESEATLTAAIQFPANRGPDYRIRVPAGLSLVRAAARPADGGSPVPIEIQRKDEWLLIKPRQPLDGRCTVVLTFVPERPLTEQTRFTFPRAEDKPDPFAMYALRLNGLAATEFARTGVIDVPADAAARAAIPFPELNLDSRPPTRAYRRTAENVELTPRLTVPTVQSHWTSSMTWTMGTRADVLAEWRCSGPLPGMLTFAIPGALTLASVRGPDVIDSTDAGDRTTLWLRTGDDPGPIRLIATMAQVKGSDYVLPVIRPPDAEKTIVRIRPAAGYAVRVQPAAGMTPLADGAYELASGVESVRVSVAAVDPPKPTASPAGTPPIATPSATTPSVASPAPAIASPSRGTNVLIWLAGMALLGIAFARSLHLIRPELILAWGILAWIAWSPLAAIGVVLGVALRIIRVLREAPSPAR